LPRSFGAAEGRIGARNGPGRGDEETAQRFDIVGVLHRHASPEKIPSVL
jgi:hypothetical protein